MSVFETFLLLSSLISLGVGGKYYYDNYKLTEYLILTIEDKIMLTDQLIRMIEEKNVRDLVNSSVQFTDKEKIDKLVETLEIYASTISWSRCNAVDPHIDKWYGGGNGYDLARKILDLLKKVDEPK